MRASYVIGFLIVLMGVTCIAAGTNNGDVITGEVRKIDNATNSIILLDSAGKEWTIKLNEQTFFKTRPAVGLKMRVTIDGKATPSRTLIATRIGLAQKKSAR